MKQHTGVLLAFNLDCCRILKKSHGCVLQKCHVAIDEVISNCPLATFASVRLHLSLLAVAWNKNCYEQAFQRNQCVQYSAPCSFS